MPGIVAWCCLRELTVKDMQNTGMARPLSIRADARWMSQELQQAQMASKKIQRERQRHYELLISAGADASPYRCLEGLDVKNS